LAPLASRRRIFPFELPFHRSGNAAESITYFYNEVTQIRQEIATLQLVFGSADGDTGDQGMFGTQFKPIFLVPSAIRNFAEINVVVFGELPLQIDDFLHFVKTARTPFESDIPVYCHPQTLFTGTTTRIFGTH
jgi:hypothetical protein